MKMWITYSCLLVHSVLPFSSNMAELWQACIGPLLSNYNDGALSPATID